ncbi:hypothetical protein LCGC14_0796370 [marine sediment metagenome]|uniref:Uncharacterized protein n=1 Tax=marine sediment metagenome TaxID=412755 RepID=A0A0F9SY88_9ZZZZ
MGHWEELAYLDKLARERMDREDRVKAALGNTNNPNNLPSYGANDGSGEVADDELPLIPTIAEVDDE